MHLRIPGKERPCARSEPREDCPNWDSSRAACANGVGPSIRPELPVMVKLIIQLAYWDS